MNVVREIPAEFCELYSKRFFFKELGVQKLKISGLCYFWGLTPNV